MGFKFERAGGRGAVFFENDLTAEHAEEIQEVLITALTDADDVELNFERVKDVDPSCIEVLCSAHRTAARLNKRLAVTGARPERFTQAIDAFRYAHRTGCCRDCYQSCLWTAR